MPSSSKVADSKGRVVLGKEFANKTVIVRKISPTKLTIEMARVVPESEMWLWANDEALTSVQRGLRQAHEQKFVHGPDVDADLELFGGGE